MVKGYLFISNSTKPTREQAAMTVHKVNTFALAPIMAAESLGYKLYQGFNCDYPEMTKDEDFDITFYDQHTYRNLFAFKDNWVAFNNLRRFLKQHPDIEVIHCNTPLGGMMGRVCAKMYGVKKVIYTAHGFHFFKGAPLFNRTILKWIEMLMARWTDTLITMNDEDYIAAQKMRLRNNGKVYKVHGVGVYTNQYNIPVDRSAIRKELGIPVEAVVGIAMGDIVPRKNYRVAIEAIALAKNSGLHYLICGRGTQIEELKKYSSELGIESQIHFLGFRTDIRELSLASDFFLFASLQEGLPRSTMEAMCAGLPCIVSDIRGNNDVVDDGRGGYLVPPRDAMGFANAINRLMSSKETAIAMSKYNKEKIKKFDMEVVKKEILDIYRQVL